MSSGLTKNSLNDEIRSIYKAQDNMGMADLTTMLNGLGEINKAFDSQLSV